MESYPGTAGTCTLPAEVIKEHKHRDGCCRDDNDSGVVIKKGRRRPGVILTLYEYGDAPGYERQHTKDDQRQGQRQNMIHLCSVCFQFRASEGL